MTASNRDLANLSELLAAASAPARILKPAKARTPKPANDNKAAPEVLAWPTLERLAYRGDSARLFALRHWRNMCFPQSVVITEEGEYEPEVSIEVRPSEAELLRAVGWTVSGRERWHFTGELVNIYDDIAPPSTEYQVQRNGALEARIGELVFRDGELRQWGRTKRGRALRPDERRRGVKGGATAAERPVSAVLSYLRLTGATSPLAAKPYAKAISKTPALGDFYVPLPREEPGVTDKVGRFGVAEARQVLEDLGVDGSVPFDRLRFAATRGPDAIAAGSGWIGGLKQPKPTASEPAGREPEFVRHIEAANYLDHLRRELGEDARILDLAITDASASDIGVAMGLSRSYAEKRGAMLIEAAIDALIKLDETARGDFAISTMIDEKIAA